MEMVSAWALISGTDNNLQAGLWQIQLVLILSVLVLLKYLLDADQVMDDSL